MVTHNLITATATAKGFLWFPGGSPIKNGHKVLHSNGSGRDDLQSHAILCARVELNEPLPMEANMLHKWYRPY